MVVGCLQSKRPSHTDNKQTLIYPYLFSWTQNDHYRRTKMKGSTTRYRIRERYWTVERSLRGLYDPRWSMVPHQGRRDGRGAAPARSRPRPRRQGERAMRRKLKQWPAPNTSAAVRTAAITSTFSSRRMCCGRSNQADIQSPPSAPGSSPSPSHGIGRLELHGRFIRCADRGCKSWRRADKLFGRPRWRIEGSLITQRQSLIYNSITGDLEIFRKCNQSFMHLSGIQFLLHDKLSKRGGPLFHIARGANQYKIFRT